MHHAIRSHLGFGTLGASLALFAGCGEREVPLGEAQAPLTVPVPTLGQYAVLASRAVSVGDRSSITGGDVGVAPGTNATLNTLTAGIDARLAIGDVLLAQRIVLRDRAIVGEVGANLIEAPLATTGPRSAYVAPPARPLPANFVAGGAAVSVNAGRTTTLSAGKFGAVTVSGTLNLSGGVYELQSLRLDPDARLVALAPATLRVTGGLAAADRSRLAPAAPLAPAALRIVVSGNVDSNVSVALSTDVQVSALLVARNVLRTGDRFAGSGSISALDVVIGNDARFVFGSGFECNGNAACNDGNPCTVDTCVDAQCARSPAADGVACSDGNACTRTDTCQAGTCTGANPVVCTALDQCHDPGSCDPASGLCSHPAKPNGSACDDGSACTRADSCLDGACTGAEPVACTAQDECHDPGSCDPASGLCSNPPKPNGSPCNDGDLCTLADSCQVGSCVGGAPVSCVATDACREPGSCDPSSGVCSSPPKADGASCDDGNACTRRDACVAGSCAGAEPVVCTAEDQCHDPGLCDPATGACSQPAKPDGVACDDQDACSHGDRCLSGACTPGVDLAVTEFDTGLTAPGYIVSGPQNSLWFLSPESSFGANDGSIARLTTAGTVSRFAISRNVYALLHGPDDMLWVGDTVPGGLPTLGRFSPLTHTFVSDAIGIQAHDLASSNDGGNPIVWFTGGSSVGRISAAGVLLSPVPTLNATRAITAARPAPNTAIWFTQANTGRGTARIGRIQFPNLTQFVIETEGELPDIVEGPDGGIWFTDPSRNEVARLAPTGASLARYALPRASSGPYAIASGPDGNLWATLRFANRVARVTPEGVVTEVCLPTPSSLPTQIAAGPDGNVWFTQSNAGKVGRIALSP